VDDIVKVEKQLGNKDIAPKMKKGAVARLAQLNKEMVNANKSQIKFVFNNKAMRDSLKETLKTINDTSEVVRGHPEVFGGEGTVLKKTKEKTVWHKMKEGFKDYKDTVEKGSITIATITAKTMKSTEDAIVNMLTGVKTDFKALANSIAADLVRMQVRKNVTVPLSNWLGDMDFSKILGFAHGGRPPVGKPSIVGERGAELFVPDSAGTIIPNNQLGGGGQVINVTYSPQINALDPRTAATVIAQNAPTIVGVIRQAFNRNGRTVAI